MIFVETPIFTRQLLALLSDEDYRALQLALLFRPESGKIIQRTGGLRKLMEIAARWQAGRCSCDLLLAQASRGSLYAVGVSQEPTGRSHPSAV